MELIVADSAGMELRTMLFSGYDFEIGNTPERNTYQITVQRGEYESIPDKARLYIPGTEYGGLFRKLETNTAQDVIMPGGLTWRGMLYRKIIQPDAGQDYATDSGELNAIIKARVEGEFPGLFVGTDESTGVTVSSYKYDRYCTLASGLEKLLKSAGYRLQLAYDQTQRAVVASAVSIIDYSNEIEWSADMRVDYTMQIQTDGVNHLVCLGTGELKDRLVRHLYVDGDGNISQTQTFSGSDEVAEVYDNPGAEEADLVQGGTERLRDLMNDSKFEIRLDADDQIAIGDIVGGRDYLSGMVMTAPITGKILRWSAGVDTVEYKIEDGVTITLGG